MKNNKTIEITKIGIITALLCIIAPLSIPIGVIPISFTNLIIYLAIFALGSKKGLISYLVYLVIGFIGMPVFSGFSGGPENFSDRRAVIFSDLSLFLSSAVYLSIKTIRIRKIQ